MATYTCSSCGMSVNATCAACNTALTNTTLTKDDGSTVQISQSQVPECENETKKIKSPLCCGADMACSIAQRQKLILVVYFF